MFSFRRQCVPVLAQRHARRFLAEIAAFSLKAFACGK
jgi:hypothetical protein